MANAVQLYRGDDRADIDGLVERRPNAEGAHSLLNFIQQRFGNALLHEQARAGAANLALIEPDAVHQAFDRTIEIGVFENNEWGLTPQFERQPFMAAGGCAAD